MPAFTLLHWWTGLVVVGFCAVVVAIAFIPAVHAAWRHEREKDEQ